MACSLAAATVPLPVTWSKGITSVPTLPAGRAGQQPRWSLCWFAASNNIIGGTTARARNVISANGLDGVMIDGGSGESPAISLKAITLAPTQQARWRWATAALGVYLWSAASPTPSAARQLPTEMSSRLTGLTA